MPVPPNIWASWAATGASVFLRTWPEDAVESAVDLTREVILAAPLSAGGTRDPGELFQALTEELALESLWSPKGQAVVSELKTYNYGPTGTGTRVDRVKVLSAFEVLRAVRPKVEEAVLDEQFALAVAAQKKRGPTDAETEYLGLLKKPSPKRGFGGFGLGVIIALSLVVLTESWRHK